MRKLKSFVLSTIIIIVLTFFTNILCEAFIKNNFSFSFITLYNDIKNESTFIQKNEADKKNVFMLYGSSELGTSNIPTNPMNYFPKKEASFIVSPVGKGYMQDLAHVIKFLANPALRGKKIGFIVSMQWFISPTGIANDDFQMNFSELQFYEAMDNKYISKDLKRQLCKRVYSLISNNSFYSDVATYSKLYSSSSTSSKLEFALLRPYFALKKALLSFSTNLKSCNLIKDFRPVNFPHKLVAINEQKDFSAAEKLGNKIANNNSFYMLNSYYNTFLKNDLSKFKNAEKNASLLNSKEYDDLDLLLKVCKANNIKPLFILMPVNGKFYDYDGINKSSRVAYTAKVKKFISRYGFQVVDFQKHEYEKYLMEDGMHLGWKGWLYVNKEIIKYHNK